MLKYLGYIYKATNIMRKFVKMWLLWYTYSSIKAKSKSGKMYYGTSVFIRSNSLKIGSSLHRLQVEFRKTEHLLFISLEI